MNEDWYAHKKDVIIGEHNDQFDVSPAWRRVENQYRYFVHSDYCSDVIKFDGQDVVNGNLGQIIKDNNIQVGDLLYFDTESDGSINHGTVISSIESDMIYYSAHSLSRKDRKLSDGVNEGRYTYTFYVIKIQN